MKKWAFHNNLQCKSMKIGNDEYPHSTQKVKHQGRKIMLSVGWSHRSMIDFEFLNCNPIIQCRLTLSKAAMFSKSLLRKCRALVN